MATLAQLNALKADLISSNPEGSQSRIERNLIDAAIVQAGLNAGVGGGPGGGASAADIGFEVDAKLKATAQPISATALPLPTGAATEATLAALQAFFNPAPTRAGGFGTAFADLAIAGKLRRVVVQNRSGATIFLGRYTKGSPLGPADVPLNGEIYTVVNNGQVVLGAADFGLHGTILPANSRIAVSTAFGAFAAPSGSNFSVFVETIA